jgi:hypothetical protein
MAARVDLRTVSSSLAALPDPTGASQAAGLMCRLLANVDLMRIVNDFGRIQDAAW